MLPMAKNGLTSVLIFNFLGLWNQFLIPVALNTNAGTIDSVINGQGPAATGANSGKPQTVTTYSNGTAN